MSELNPGKFLGISGSYWRSCALHAALRLDVFSALARGTSSSSDLSGVLNCDERGLATLLDALVAMEILDKRQEQFSNTEAGAAFLVKSSPRYVGYLILHHAELVDSWRQLDKAVRTGKPVRSRSSGSSGPRLEHFLRGMHVQAMGVAPRAVGKIDLGGRDRLLDLGGGPGTWSIQFALHHPQLKATVFDLPVSRPFAEETIAKFGVSDRVSFAGGDFTRDDLPDGHTIALLSHILHGEGPEHCAEIIRKAAQAVGSGGLLLIHEFILDEERTSPAFPSIFSLNMLVGTPQGRSYTRQELEEMLLDAGTTKPRLVDFYGPTESRILAAEIE